MDATIVIVSWNARHYLQQCLASLEKHINGVAYEVVVVDNNSSDGSPEMVREQFPNVRLIESGGNLGFAKANNIAIRQTESRYVCLVNSDIEMITDCLKEMLDYLDQHPSIGMLGPKILNGDRTLQVSWRHFPGYVNSLIRALAMDTVFGRTGQLGTPPDKADRPLKVDMMQGCFWVVRREALKKVGLLDEQFFMYAEDTDWCKRFHLAGWDVVFYPRTQVVHYGGRSSSNNPIKFYTEKTRSDFMYWRKHHGVVGLAYIYCVTLLYEFIRAVRGGLLLLLKPSDREQSMLKATRSLANMRWLAGFCIWRNGRSANSG